MSLFKQSTIQSNHSVFSINQPFFFSINQLNFSFQTIYQLVFSFSQPISLFNQSTIQSFQFINHSHSVLSINQPYSLSNNQPIRHSMFLINQLISSFESINQCSVSINQPINFPSINQLLYPSINLLAIILSINQDGIFCFNF